MSASSGNGKLYGFIAGTIGLIVLFMLAIPYFTKQDVKQEARFDAAINNKAIGKLEMQLGNPQFFFNGDKQLIANAKAELTALIKLKKELEGGMDNQAQAVVAVPATGTIPIAPGQATSPDKTVKIQPAMTEQQKAEAIAKAMSGR